MVIVNPLLLASADQILAYQESRVSDWTKKLNTDPITFDNYFEKLAAQWSMDDFYSTSIDIDEFNSIKGIDTALSFSIRNKLSDAKLIDRNGFINLKEISDTAILNAISSFEDHELSPQQKTAICNQLNALSQNKITDFETFTKFMFTTNPANPEEQHFKITETESEQIWKNLNLNGAIDDFGVLLFEPHSEELKSIVARIPELTESQKDRVFSLLNQHPELSYHAYLSQFNRKEDPEGPTPVGIYMSNGKQISQENALTQEQLNYIRIMAILEWNTLIMSQKSIHNSRKKSAEKIKSEKKQSQAEQEKFWALMEAKYREENKKKNKK
jgi:hypothetical protein